ncbi:methyltransferase type 11 [Acidobacteria bacterium Mor1]|nr:methyltransferase type 11 [Acidobacteria bacterium Mor1]
MIAAVLIAMSAGVAASASGAPTESEASHYTTREASPDGIGKVYMGREISFVLGHRGTQWLERDDRERRERPDLLVKSLALAEDTVIADIGAGSGYFTFRLCREVPRGQVLAVDIQQEMLDFIENKKKRKKGAGNVRTVLGTITDPNLEPGSVDAVLIVDAYHEFSHPREMMAGIVRGLKPGGKLYLVEYRAEDPEVPILPLHKMTEAQARKEMAVAGLRFEENRDVLPQQHLMVFVKPENPSSDR